MDVETTVHINTIRTDGDQIDSTNQLIDLKETEKDTTFPLNEASSSKIVENEQTDQIVLNANEQQSTATTDLTSNNNEDNKQSKSEFNNPKFETVRMRDYLKRAKQATSQYNKMINQERKDERRYCFDLQTYTLHYPIGLGAENRMLKKNVENGRCSEKNKYPIAVLPGHFQTNYRKYTSDELKYFPINTVIYGPVITDTDKLPPLLTRIEEDCFSDSDESSLSTEHSCCCDEKTCKKLKLENSCASDPNKCNCIDEISSSSSDDEQEIDEQPPKLVNVYHFTQRENATCDVCKKGEQIRPDSTQEKLIHCSDCVLSFHPSCLEMSAEMIQQIQLYPWECSRCKRCVICSNDYYESNMLICDLCDKASHSHCVGLKTVPLGKWFCKLCAARQKYIKR